MFFGATSTSANRGTRQVDLNLLPTEYRSKPFPILSIGLAVLALGCAFLLYAAYYAKAYTDLEIAQLTSRVNQGEVVVRAATGDPAAAARQDQLRAMRDDYNVLAQRQINWGDVFQTIGDAPPGVVVNAISQAGFGATVTGSAADSAAAAAYLSKLRASKLFVDAALQLVPATVVATSTPSETPVPPTEPPATVAPPATPVPPAQAVARVNTPVPARANPPAQARAPAAPIPTRTPIPTITPTPPNTETATPTASPTSAFDFVLLTTKQIPTSNPMAGSSDIKGTVVDLNGKPMGGLTIEIDSEGSPPWSSTRITDPTNGSFDFVVTHGKFKVFVVAGRSQAAVDLYTGADGVAPTYGYQLAFQATFTGTPSPEVIGTPTDTQTPTSTVTPSDTPISLGQNIASWGCANAYLQNSPSVHLGNNANLAIDGNLGTEWNSAVAPSNGSYVIWQWSLPSRATKCNDGRTAAGLPDSQDQIEGFQLIPDQNPAGNTIHELWLYADPGCTSNLHTDNTAFFPWNGQTSAGLILPLRLSPAVLVRCIIVRTIASPSFVAWEEIQIYQTVPPPQGFSTLTVTPTFTQTSTSTVTGTPPTATSSPTVSMTGTPTVTGTPPTAIPTPTQTMTGTATSTPIGSITATGTASPTATRTSTASPSATLTRYPVVAGVNVAPTSGIINSSPTAILCALTPAPGPSTPTPGPTNVCNAIDDNSQTYWAPSGGPDPQGIRVSLHATQIPQPDLIGDLRVEVQSLGTGGAVTYELSANRVTPISCVFQSPSSGYIDHTQLDCLFTTPIPSVDWASVLIFRGGVQDGSYGVREFQIYNQVLPSVGLHPCQNACAEPTPASAPHIVITPGPSMQRGSVAPTSTTTTVGRGQGPGDSAVFGPNEQPFSVPRAAAAPSPTPTGATPIPPPPPPSSGPVDFTIVLEVASGTGY